MRLDDWRNLPAAALQSVYEAERVRWSTSLQWDLAPSLATIEQARAAGTLPGLVIRGPGQSVVGWTYFLVQHGVLHRRGNAARSAVARGRFDDERHAQRLVAHQQSVSELAGIAETLAVIGEQDDQRVVVDPRRA